MAGLPLSELRQTPWLARKLAIAYVPSISALVTLRALPPIRGQRDPFIGFGDPEFGTHAEKSPSAGAGVKRGAGKAPPRTLFENSGISRIDFLVSNGSNLM